MVDHRDLTLKVSTQKHPKPVGELSRPTARPVPQTGKSSIGFNSTSETKKPRNFQHQSPNVTSSTLERLKPSPIFWYITSPPNFSWKSKKPSTLGSRGRVSTGSSCRRFWETLFTLTTNLSPRQVAAETEPTQTSGMKSALRSFRSTTCSSEKTCAFMSQNTSSSSFLENLVEVFHQSVVDVAYLDQAFRFGSHIHKGTKGLHTCHLNHQMFDPQTNVR